MKKNFTFYSAKALACFCVICIHITFPGKVGKLILNFSRFAVPLFFMISGYYSYNIEKRIVDSNIKKRLIKICKITCVSSIFYIIFNFIINIASNNITNYIIEIKSWKNLIKFLLFNYTPPYIGVGHLWYLFALIYIYGILKIVNRFDLYKISYIYSIIAIISVYIIEIINVCNYNNISEFWLRNVWLYGFPFFMIGNFIHKKEKTLIIPIDKINIFFAFSSLIVIVSYFLETILLRGNIFLFLNSFFINIFIFIIAINFPNIKFLYKLGEFDSGNIYIIHAAIVVIINNYFNQYFNNFFGYLLPFIVFGVSYLISIWYRKANNWLSKNFKKH